MERAEKFAVSVAIFLMVIGIVSAISLPKQEVKEYLEVNGTKLSFDEIFKKCPEKELEIMEENYTGASLSCILNLTKIGNPGEYRYTIIGADGYQKTVSWDDMKKGILTKEKRVIFPHLRKAYWVGDVVKIEVV